MTTRLIPEIGQWYAHRDKGLVFQVVAVDAAGDCVEIQDCDGDVDEIDLAEWFAMPIEPTAAPEDATGPADAPDTAEREYTLQADGADLEWRDPLEDLAAEGGEPLDDDDEDAPVRH
jgi:hypothetical protein